MRIFRFDEIDSTSDFFKRMEDKREFDLAIAKSQTNGRGRRGNNWVSSQGMAMFSFLLKVDENISLEEYSKLPLVTGLAVLRGINRIEDLDLKFKWTNDIYLNGKKLCGILVEKYEDFFIIGIGINVNNKELGSVSDRATSMTNVTGKSYILDDIIFTVLDEFKKQYNRFSCGEWDLILQEINYRNYLKGKVISITNSKRTVFGIGGDIAPDGQLEVEIDSKKEFFNVGEVHIEQHKNKNLGDINS